MTMTDWRVTNAIENLAGDWVYYMYFAANTILQGIHFSRHVDNPGDDHMATNDGQYYYFGFTGTFNGNVPQAIRDALVEAWNDYFSVR